MAAIFNFETNYTQMGPSSSNDVFGWYVCKSVIDVLVIGHYFRLMFLKTYKLIYWIKHCKVNLFDHWSAYNKCASGLLQLLCAINSVHNYWSYYNLLNFIVCACINCLVWPSLKFGFRCYLSKVQLWIVQNFRSASIVQKKKRKFGQ